MDVDDLRRLAGSTGFDLATLEKDYALTWLLSGIYSQESKLRDNLIFKGGTAIRKVYFPEWRLSEDLDFTVLRRVMSKALREDFERVFSSIKTESSIAYAFDSFSASAYTILADVQFLGPLNHKNRIAHDISLKEKLVEEPVWIKVTPEYEDVPEFEIQVYSINEVLVEKIRSIMQRGKARDYYDVWRLMKERKFQSDKIRELLVQKCKITEVGFKPELIFDKTRVSEAKKFWTIALSRLTKNLPDFGRVIKELRTILDWLVA